MASLGFVLRRTGQGVSHFFGNFILIGITIALTLVAFGGFLLAQHNLAKLLRSWGDRFEVTAYLAPKLGGDELAGLLANLKNDPAIDSVSYTSSEQAWRDFQAGLGARAGLLDGLPQSVLPASLQITLRPQYRDDDAVAQLASRLKVHQALTQIDYPQQWLERLTLVVAALHWLQWAIAGGLFLVTFFIVTRLIKLTLLARRQEIEVLQLVGATEALIQAPMVFEALLQGLFGAGCALAVLWGIWRWLRDDPIGLGDLVPLLGRVEFLDGADIALMFAIGILLAAAASLLALRGMIDSWEVHRSVH